MNKVAVFGNAGGGKSTLSKRLAQTTGLPSSVPQGCGGVLPSDKKTSIDLWGN